MGNLKPVAPRKKLILTAAFCFGLLFPLVVIYICETMNTAVRGRKDLGKLSVPFMGEIPLYTDRTEQKKRAGQDMAVIRQTAIRTEKDRRKGRKTRCRERGIPRAAHQSGIHDGRHDGSYPVHIV